MGNALHNPPPALSIHRPRHPHQPWPNGLQACIQSTLPWIATDCCPLTTADVIENLTRQRPHVWVATLNMDTLAATSLTHITPGGTATLHGISHQNNIATKAVKQAAIASVSLAALEAAFTEHHAHTVLAHVPKSHAGARGFCWNTGFTRTHNPQYQQPPVIIAGRSIPVITYALCAKPYYAASRARLLTQYQQCMQQLST